MRVLDPLKLFELPAEAYFALLDLTFQPVIADAWQTFFGLVVFILWSVGQWLSARNEAKQEQKPRRPRPQPPQPEDLVPVEGRPRQGQRQGPPNQEEALRSEVEEFLRRAQGKPPRPKPTPEPVVRTQPPLRQEPLKTSPVARESQSTMRTEGVAEHVSRHLSTAEIADHTKQLGATVATADDRLESHLQQKFDHELGSLEQRESKAKPAAKEDAKKEDVAVEIAQMLRSPQGMRQLIVANEILRRPDW